MEEIEKDMTPKLIKDLGMRYPTEKSSRKYRYGLYECQYCGKEFEAIISSIKSKSTVSCGCHRAQFLTNTNKKTHGLTSHKYYQTWYDMNRRCFNPENKAYKYYDARGISVCAEWLDVTNFVAWAESTHPNIEGISLDRIDNDKGYSPENCRWADKLTQRINQRVSIRNTSGFVGVFSDIFKNKWCAKVRSNNKLINIGQFSTKEEAVIARDQYIIDNGLPHKLSTDYTKG